MGKAVRPAAATDADSPIFASPKSSSFAPERVIIRLPGLEVSMHHTMPVSLVERAGNLDGTSKRLVQWKRAFLQPRGDGFTLQILHHQIIDTVILADIVQRANVWMAQARNGLRLALEPLARLRVDREVFPPTPDL